MKNVALFLVLIIIAVVPLSAGESPGAVGAYVNFGMGQSTTPEDVRALVDDAADAGIQFLLPYARTTEGRTYYRSKLMPEIDRGFDILGTLIDQAHKRGLKVYPWFCINSEGLRELSPLLEEHPDWCMVNVDGKRVGWLDPSCPEARQFIISAVEELAANYDIDGINLDYLRYATPGRFCFCDRCKTQFKERFGYDAHDAHSAEPYTDAWAKWRLWRQQQINRQAREIHAALKKVKPDASVSAYVWGDQAYGTGWQICQDWKTWNKEGLLDWVNPSGYYAQKKEFVRSARDNRAAARNLPMLVTLMVSRRIEKAAMAERAKWQIRDSMDLGADGIIFFTLEYVRPHLKELAPLLQEIGRDQQSGTL